MRHEINTVTTRATNERKNEADQIRGLRSYFKSPCCICVIFESVVLSILALVCFPGFFPGFLFSTSTPTVARRPLWPEPWKFPHPHKPGNSNSLSLWSRRHVSLPLSMFDLVQLSLCLSGGCCSYLPVTCPLPPVALTPFLCGNL